MTGSKSDAEILAESREWIEEHGWTKGRMHDYDTERVCSLGAIVLSQQWWEDEDDYEVHPQFLDDLDRLAKKLLAVLGRTDPKNTGACLVSVASWNDSQAKDQQEVLDVFAKAEKIERAGFDPDEGTAL